MLKYKEATAVEVHASIGNSI